jgi:hypothetical protein
VKSVEAAVDERGAVRLLEPITLTEARRAIVIVLDEPPRHECSMRAVGSEARSSPDTSEPSSDESLFPVSTKSLESGTSDSDRSVPSMPPDHSYPDTRSLGQPGEAGGWESRYDRVRELGRGGMGIAFQARNKVTNHDVCIKELLGSLDKKTLLQEFRALARLHHPNIVRLIDFEAGGGRPYLVMEYLEGETLKDLMLSRHQFNESETVDFGVQLFDALAHAHHGGVIHCDLKPGNIMVVQEGGRQVLKVLDFGIAVVDLRDQSDNLTAEGRFVGTPEYMAPEQLEGAQLTGACDVYAAGQTLWEMLMGWRAFSRATIWEKTRGPLIADGAIGVSRKLGDLIEQCTQPDTDRRPTADEALGRLKALSGRRQWSEERRDILLITFLLLNFIILILFIHFLIYIEGRKATRSQGGDTKPAAVRSTKR